MEEWQKPETITFWLIIIICFFIVLLSFILLIIYLHFKRTLKVKTEKSNAQIIHQQHLMDITIRTQEKERERIASDIHDALIGKLIAFKIQQEFKKHGSKDLFLITQSIDIARRISHDLSPPLISFTSIQDLLNEIILPLEMNHKIDITYDIRVSNITSVNFKTQIIRIVQEIATNITKYASASSLTLHFRQSEKYISLKITDNGKGFILDKNHKGLGLQNIETRVAYLKGTFKIKSKIKKGTSTIFVFNSLLAKQV